MKKRQRERLVLHGEAAPARDPKPRMAGSGRVAKKPEWDEDELEERKVALQLAQRTFQAEKGQSLKNWIAMFMDACDSNLLRKRHRGFKRSMRTVAIEDLPSEPWVGDTTSNVAARIDIGSLLHRMDDSVRCFIQNRFLLGMSFNEAALTAGLSISGAKRLLRDLFE
jgi:DNA-directed RNA polymerase specialized sigma24 family protein